MQGGNTSAFNKEPVVGLRVCLCVFFVGWGRCLIHVFAFGSGDEGCALFMTLHGAALNRIS